ncbi:hypothetical protein HY419_00960 [candidate division WWE3 bacterium]|nr:hypothetical protein [candidate division WWE3 bacterium]
MLKYHLLKFRETAGSKKERNLTVPSLLTSATVKSGPNTVAFLQITSIHEADGDAAVRFLLTVLVGDGFLAPEQWLSQVGVNTKRGGEVRRTDGITTASIGYTLIVKGGVSNPKQLVEKEAYRLQKAYRSALETI